jgi:RNA 2',3'-cyclic 3'-phosphodiesterase
MSEQMHRLFFALRPDARVAGEIEGAAAAIRLSRRVRGRWVKPPKHHLTLQFLGDHAAHAGHVIERARAAAASVRSTPFDIVLDRAETFAEQRRSPFVLRCSPDSDKAAGSLRSALGDALATEGLADLLEDRFAPHVTIAYIDGHLSERIAIEPIIWHVREFTFIDSHVGQSRHEALDHWRLSA